MAKQNSRHGPVTAAAQKQPTDPAAWLTPAEYVEQFPRLASVSAIRWAILNRASNGLAEVDAVRLVGARWLVHPQRFSAWRLGEQPSPIVQPAN
jgi:hypothetical protein